jgi:hypothetical protein
VEAYFSFWGDFWREKRYSEYSKHHLLKLKSRQLLITAVFLGFSSLVIIGFLVWKGVLTPQNILPSFAAGNQYGNPQTHFGCADIGKNGKVNKVNDSDPKIKYSKEWAYKKGGGGSQICYQEDYHFAPDFVTKKLDATKNYHASMTYSFTGNQVGVRFIEGGNRGFADISIDGVKVDSYNSHTGGGIYGRPPWISPDLACGEHTIKVEQSDTDTSTHGKVIVVDYIQYRNCTPNNANVCAKLAGIGADTNGCTKINDGQACPTAGPKHLVCINDACALSETATVDDPGCVGKTVGTTQCTPTGETHIVCGANNTCTTSTTAAGNDPKCSGKTVGSSCAPVAQTHIVCGSDLTCATSTTATSDDPSCSGKEVGGNCGVSTEELKCQGNPDAPAKCFDCKKDSSTNASSSEINILDFSCFAKYYGKEVGKN